MDFTRDTDINELRRGSQPELVVDREQKPQSDIFRFENRDGLAFNEYRAFSISVADNPVRLCMKTNRLIKVMPRYDLLYNIVCDFGCHFIALVFPFMTVKIYGNNLGDLQGMLEIQRVNKIEEFEPRFHVFPKDVDLATEPVITEIVIEGSDIDAEQERLDYLERVRQDEEDALRAEEEQPGG